MMAPWEAEIRRIAVQDQPGQKVHKPSISPSGWGWWCVLVIPAIRRCINRKITVQVCTSIKQDPIFKLTTEK
jgi:hypothetical protein